MYVSHALEVYLLLFVDSLVASLVLPLSRLTAFNIMCCFGGYSAVASVIIGALGASLGGVINCFLGKLIYMARMVYHKPKSPTVTPKLVSVILISLLGALAWLHIVGALINVLCGYFKVKLRYAYLAVFLSYLVYLITQAMTSECILS